LPSLQDGGAAVALTGDVWQIVPDGAPDPAQMARLAAPGWTLPGDSQGGFGLSGVMGDEAGPAGMSLVSCARQLVRQMEM